MPVSPDDHRAPYIQIADEMRKAITSGEYAPGQRLPSGRALAKQYGVAAMTIQNAIRELRAEGIVVAWQGRGVFVRNDTDDAGGGDAASVKRLIDQMESIQHGLQRLEDRVDDLEAQAATRHPKPRRDG